MSTIPLPPDNSYPLIVGYQYRLAGNGEQWVVITQIVGRNIYVKGLGNTIAEWFVPDWKFDDNVREWRNPIESPA